MPDHAELTRHLEAILFAAGRPLSERDLTRALEPFGAPSRDTVRRLVEGLAEEFPVDGMRGFELARVGGGWLFRTNRRSSEALAVLFNLHDDTRLSPAALETLAIIAYLQPVSRPQIADIRGVASESAVQTLMDKGLVHEVGRDDGPGGAILYGTTERFQVMFGLESLQDLPNLDEFSVGDDDREELRRRLTLTLTD
ncbi:MAG: SMC-Scp complex subunit ScpB [Thermoleophilia bacterium]